MLAQIPGFDESFAFSLRFLVLTGSRGCPLRGNIGLVATTSDVVGNHRSIDAAGGMKLAPHDCYIVGITAAHNGDLSACTCLLGSSFGTLRNASPPFASPHSSGPPGAHEMVGRENSPSDHSPAGWPRPWH
jgi:hypothetical protein